MKWLLWREYRLSRLILIVGALLLLLPYVTVLIALWWPWRPEGGGIPRAYEAFFAAALYSLVLSQLTVALLGGNAMAGERADRSAEFMAYLPVSRPRRLAAKLVLALAAAALLWGVNLAVLLPPLSFMPRTGPRDYAFFLYLLGNCAITGVTFFGVAWLISSLQSSPTFAVCAGLIAPLVIVMGLQGTAWVTDAPSLDRFIRSGYAIVSAVVAVACLSIGTWYYLRRVEP